MEQQAYIRLRGPYGRTWREELQTNFLPIVSHVPETVSGEEYGDLVILHVDSSRLTADVRTRLINWMLRDGDNPNRAELEADLLANKVSYLLTHDDFSEIVFHLPNPWN